MTQALFHKELQTQPFHSTFDTPVLTYTHFLYLDEVSHSDLVVRQSLDNRSPEKIESSYL